MIDIPKSLKKEITSKINALIDSYLSKSMNSKDIFRYMKKKRNLDHIIKDIDNVGLETFKTEVEYKNFIKNLLANIITDRKSDILDNSNESFSVMDFKSFTNTKN